MAQPGPALENGFENHRRGVAVLNIGAVHDKADQEAAGVGDDVAFAAIDLFPGVKAPYSAAFGGFNALAVDHARRRAGFAARSFARRHHQRVVHRPPESAVAPLIEVVLNRGERREILRQQPPLAARPCNERQRVHNLAQIDGARAAKTARRGQHGLQQCPLRIAQITCIPPLRRLILPAGDISPGHRDLLRIFANPIESQPADITQLFFGQALRVENAFLLQDMESMNGRYRHARCERDL
jgi:hypothetical protein